jgi:hypothetical protein
MLLCAFYFNSGQTSTWATNKATYAAAAAAAGAGL